MNDHLFLFFAAVGCSVVAWMFWHFLGADALNALLTIALIFALVDNRRLRRQLHISR